MKNKKENKNTLSSRFLIIWLGQLISNIGSGLTAFALGIYIFQLTGSATNYSLISFGCAGYLADKIFNPLLQPNGALSTTVGYLIGTGKGRGIGLIFILSGLFVSIIAIIISRLKKIKELDHFEE